jgi:hypothetical protein
MTTKGTRGATGKRKRPVDKAALVAQLRAQVAREIEVLRTVQRDTSEGATHEENRPEGSKDMRSTEASYLARGQAGRVEDLQRVLSVLHAMTVRAFGPDEPVSASALVVVECDGARSVFFMAPQGGGMRVEIDGVEVQVITPRSPVGAALLGKTTGDDADVQTQQGRRTYEIISVE